MQKFRMDYRIAMTETNRWLMPLKPAEDVLFQRLGDETVLLNLRTEQYYGLDPVGSRIWQLLEQDGRAEHVLAAMLSEYDVDENTLRADVERIVNELIDASLLEPSGQTP
jgi:hypothetical protein